MATGKIDSIEFPPVGETMYRNRPIREIIANLRATHNDPDLEYLSDFTEYLEGPIIFDRPGAFVSHENDKKDWRLALAKHQPAVLKLYERNKLRGNVQDMLLQPLMLFASREARDWQSDSPLSDIEWTHYQERADMVMMPCIEVFYDVPENKTPFEMLTREQQSNMVHGLGTIAHDILVDAIQRYETYDAMSRRIAA